MIDNKSPESPVAENPPSSAGHTGLIPGWGTKIPDVMEHLSPSTASTELLHSGTTAREKHTGCHDAWKRDFQCSYDVSRKTSWRSNLSHKWIK